MSAIFAIMRRDGEIVEPYEIETMLDTVQHQMFDGRHVWNADSVALAHQHLWITPEEQGERQPLTLADGSFSITFDGRLDNRPNLLHRLDLSQVDADLVTDAQIVLHAYRMWGEQCVIQLLGDFAFVIWDAAKRQLFIARDPLGVRPISYYCDSRACIVASTVAPILAHPGVEAKINDVKIAEYIADYNLDQEDSFFCNVHFCPPAHYILVSSGSVEKRRYWLPDLEQRIHHNDPQEYVDEFLELFRHSVTARTRVAGKIGVALSSGMDSSSVAAIAYEKLLENGRLPQSGLNTYTLTYEGTPDCDEQHNVRDFSSHFDFNSSFVRVDNIRLFNETPLPLMAADYLVYLMTDPHLWHLAQQMQRDGLRVALCGVYGDLLFSPQKYWAQDAVRGRGSRLTLRLLDPRIRGQAEFEVVKQRSRRLARQMINRLSLHRFRGIDIRLDAFDEVGMEPDLANTTNIRERILENPLQQHYAASSDLRCATAMLWDYPVHSTARLLPGFSTLGLEWWDPYRDRRLFEYILAIPAFLAGQPGPGNNKWLLREAMRGIVPEKTRTQPRFPGFISWAHAWFGSEEGQKLADLMRDPLVSQYGYYRRAWIEERLAAHSRKPQFDYELWQCICLEFWLHDYGSVGDGTFVT